MEMKPRKRIAIVVRPAAGGIRRHVTLLCSRLVQNYDVILFAPADFTLDRPVSDIEQIALAISAKTNPIHDWLTIRRLTHLLKLHRCEWVHAHGIRAALIGVIAGKRAGIPAFFTAHNLVVDPSRFQKTVLGSIGMVTDRVIAVSEAVKLTLVDCGIAAAKIAVIPNGIDLAEIDAKTAFEPFPFKGKIIAAVGRLSPEKGFDYLLEEFGKVSQGMPEAHLVIAGAGAEESKLKAIAAALPHPECVHFLGYVEDTANVYHAADVIAVPSHEEGQGIVAIEAMAYRKPVVASNVGGLSETIVSGETGIIVKRSFAEELLFLLRFEEKAKAMGEAGRKRVEQEYTVEMMIERIEVVYRAVQ